LLKELNEEVEEEKEEKEDKREKKLSSFEAAANANFVNIKQSDNKRKDEYGPVAEKEDKVLIGA